MRDCFSAHCTSHFPDEVRGMKYSRVLLENGVVAGSRSAPPDDDGARRRSNCVRIRSTDRVETVRRAVEEVSIAAHGLVLHNLASFAGGTPTAFALIECIRSGIHRLGKYGLPRLALGYNASAASVAADVMFLLVLSTRSWAHFSPVGSTTLSFPESHSRASNILYFQFSKM